MVNPPEDSDPKYTCNKQQSCKIYTTKRAEKISRQIHIELGASWPHSQKIHRPIRQKNDEDIE